MIPLYDAYFDISSPDEFKIIEFRETPERKPALLHHNISFGSDEKRFFKTFEGLLISDDSMQKEFELLDKLDYEAKFAEMMHRPGSSHKILQEENLE